MSVVINSIEKLIDCLQLQDANLPTYETEVGATGADISAVNTALLNLIYIRDYAELVDANKKTVTQIKNAVFNGDPTDTVAPFPDFPTGAFPATIRAGELDRALTRNNDSSSGRVITRRSGSRLGSRGLRRRSIRGLSCRRSRFRPQAADICSPSSSPAAASPTCGTF
jgi:hypothetical protein